MVLFILHTHLPYVLHHGAWPHGSDWLCEATAECYVPLLDMCERLMDDGIRPGITFDISPVLCEQLTHPDFADVFVQYCEAHAVLAEGDVEQLRTDGAPQEQIDLSTYWADWYRARSRRFTEAYHGNIVAAMRDLQERGAIEIMTCGATHGYFPLLAEDRSIRLQVRLAKANYAKHFGRAPRGIWLPECGYRPAYPWRTLLPVAAYSVARWRAGVEQVLSDEQLDFFVTDEPALEKASPVGLQSPSGRVHYDETYGAARARLDERSVYDLFRVTSETHAHNAVCFTRNLPMSMQVWSGDSGYPGDPDYLDFHKKYFRSAMRYWRVTDVKADMQYKQFYNPTWAANKARVHAKHFVKSLAVALLHRESHASGPATMCLPFDTELFGHWWYEGPLFLEEVIRGIHATGIIHTSTASEQLDRVQPDMEIALPESSWGENAHHDVWMNPATQWTWEREYALEHRMSMLYDKHPPHLLDATSERIVKAAMRELLLAQASDWQFLISTFSAKDYATMRFHSHAADCVKLCDMVERYSVRGSLTSDDETALAEIETRDGIFSELQLDWWS